VKIKKQETFYERLEFLGDAFLDLLVVEYLYDKGGDYINDEGTLSFLKQSAVSNKTLGFIALRLNLHDLILMNLADIDNTLKEFRFLNKSLKGMPTPAEFAKLKIGSLKVLGDVFESLIGAILIDLEFSYEATKEVIMGIM
jgi:endoribonuclease Dicer